MVVMKTKHLIAAAAVTLVAMALPARAGVNVTITFGVPVVFHPPVVRVPVVCTPPVVRVPTPVRVPVCAPPVVVPTPVRVPVCAPPVVMRPPVPACHRVIVVPPHPGRGHHFGHDRRGWVREEHGRGPGGPGGPGGPYHRR